MHRIAMYRDAYRIVKSLPIASPSVCVCAVCFTVFVGSNNQEPSVLVGSNNFKGTKALDPARKGEIPLSLKQKRNTSSLISHKNFKFSLSVAMVKVMVRGK